MLRAGSKPRRHHFFLNVINGLGNNLVSKAEDLRFSPQEANPGEKKALITVFMGTERHYLNDSKQLLSAPRFDRLRGILTKH